MPTRRLTREWRNTKWHIACRPRSEEHTSELQSRLHLVCRLLLEKKKKQTATHYETRRTDRPRSQGQPRPRRIGVNNAPTTDKLPQTKGERRTPPSTTIPGANWT